MTEAKEQIESFLNDAKVWSFNVKFNNTQDNWKIMESFKDFCRKETGDNYLLGINKLLDYYTMDFKYASLFDLIEQLRADLTDVSTALNDYKNREVVEKKPSDRITTFGE